MAGTLGNLSPNLLTVMQNVETHGRLFNESLGAKPDLNYYSSKNQL